jgi:hypothetical protein
VGNPFVDGHGILNAAAAVGSTSMALNQSVPTVVTQIGQTVSTETAVALSSWNPGIWTGSTWNGSTWNGSTWN